MSKAKNRAVPVPAGKPGQQRWGDQYPSKPFVERRIAQRIAGDTGSMDKPVTYPKGKK